LSRKKAAAADDDLDFDWKAALREIRKLRASFAPNLYPRRIPPPHDGVKASEYIGFVPTPMRLVHRMLQMAEIEAGETVYDLGCGDGRILISAARKYGARGVGVEIDRDRIESARQRAAEFGDRIRFLRQNVFKTDLRRADVVMIYLLPKLNAKLMPRLRKLKRGVRIVTHSFQLPGIAPYKVARVKTPEGRSHELFAYRTPLRRDKG
jgi:SAM-dependent methyltransferase